MMKDWWYLFLRQVRSSRRMPAVLFLAIFQPIVWVVLFSQLFQSIASVPGFDEKSYITFLTPGIAVMTALFGAAYSGMGLLGDMYSGMLDRLLATPISRSALIAGPLGYTTFQTVIQVSIIVVIGFALGARPKGGVAGFVLLLVASALLGLAFGGISNWLAILTHRQNSLIAMVNFLSLPLTFLSTMMMERKLMPHWMRIATEYNPVDWAVTVSRASFEGRWQAVWARLILLSVFALVSCILATTGFMRYQRSC
ncbi:MAG: ABC transporter permease [Candidatus Acidiferrales bacterium]